jgi:hypothetical protein
MVAHDLEKRVELLETRIEQIQAILGARESAEKNWRRAVAKYAGDEDLLAVFAEAKKLREAERKEIRRKGTRRSRP